VPDSILILLPAMLTGLLVLATHVPLGQLVLARGIVFIDIAIAQVAAVGAVAGHVVWGGEPQGTVAQACAVGAALAAAAFLAWTDRRVAKSQEAVIGAVYVAAASAQLLLLGFDPHGAEYLKDLLIGQILWVSPADLIPLAVLSGIVLAMLWSGHLARRRILFYAAFALAITASVQLVGVLLVFASLILPALALGWRQTPRGRLFCGYAAGVSGYALGLAASLWTDAPTGAAIVCALALVTAPLALRARPI